MATAAIRAHTLDAIANLVREEDLTDKDILDLGDQIDNGAHPADWTGPGKKTHQALLAACWDLDENAADLLHSATVDILGW